MKKNSEFFREKIHEIIFLMKFLKKFMRFFCALRNLFLPAIMPNIVLKSRSRRSLPLCKRDSYGLNALERLRIQMLSKNIELLCKLLQKSSENAQVSQLYRGPIMNQIADEYRKLLRIVVVEVPDRMPRIAYDPMNFAAMEAKLNSLEITCSERFRFQSFTQLRDIIICFQIPDIIKLNNGYRVSAEECLLISLTRLHFPCRWNDMYIWFPGRKRWFMQAAFYWFLDFFIFNWGYLLLNNLSYWKPFLPYSCEAIRVKLQNLNYVNWRLFFPPAGQPNGFQVALFIDNTICAFSRPGGNTEEGPVAIA